jgi:hypothetical protein
MVSPPTPRTGLDPCKLIILSLMHGQALASREWAMRIALKHHLRVSTTDMPKAIGPPSGLFRVFDVVQCGFSTLAAGIRKERRVFSWQQPVTGAGGRRARRHNHSAR